MQGDKKVARKRRKGKYENPYVAKRINEIREVENMMFNATDEYPRESQMMRWKRMWDKAVAGLSTMELHNRKQCSECGEVFLKNEFISRIKTIPSHDTCRRCRPTVRARVKWRAIRDERHRREAEFSRRSELAALKAKTQPRIEAITAVKKQWRERTRQNRHHTQRLLKKMEGGDRSSRVREAYKARVKLGRYHVAVRKEMEADHADAGKHIVDAKWYFDGDDLREKYGIAPHVHGQMTDQVKDVIGADALDTDEFDVEWSDEP